MRLCLSKAFFEQICQHAVSTFPAEACGLLSGKVVEGDYHVTAIWPATNVLQDQLGRFELDPACRLRVEKTCRAVGDRVIGHWHSHPGAPAEPSATDRQHAFEPDMVWLIVATDGKMATAWGTYLSPLTETANFTTLDLQFT